MNALFEMEQKSLRWIYDTDAKSSMRKPKECLKAKFEWVALR